MNHYNFCLVLLLRFASATQPQPCNKDYLYVWAGNDLGDHVITLEYAPGFNYGSVLSRSYLPNTTRVAPTNNEAHHAAISGDGKWLLTGGLVSFLQGKDSIFVWSIDPITKFPTFAYSVSTPTLGCIDEFVPIDDERLLWVITAMCNASAVAPGGLIKLNLRNREVSRFDSGPVGDSAIFNPHGAGFSPDYGFISADYIQPATLFTNSFLFRDTLHHFNPDGSFNGTIFMPTTNGGYMDFKFSPKEGLKHLGVSSSSTTNVLYRANSRNHSEIVFLLDIAAALKVPIRFTSGICHFTSTGNRLISTFQFRYVVLLEVSPQLTSAKILHSFDFCTLRFDREDQPINFAAVCNGTGVPASHYTKFAADGKRLIVTNYFIQVGNAQLAGSRSVHSFLLVKDPFTHEIDSFTYENDFHPDISVTTHGGIKHVSNPHAVAEGVWSSSGFTSVY